MASPTTTRKVPFRRGRKVRSTAENPQGTAPDTGSSPVASITRPIDVTGSPPRLRDGPTPPTTDQEWVVELIRVLEWLVYHDSQHHAPNKGWQATLVESYLIRAREHVESVKPVKPRGAR